MSNRFSFIFTRHLPKCKDFWSHCSFNIFCQWWCWWCWWKYIWRIAQHETFKLTEKKAWRLQVVIWKSAILQSSYTNFRCRTEPAQSTNISIASNGKSPSYLIIMALQKHMHRIHIYAKQVAAIHAFQNTRLCDIVFFSYISYGSKNLTKKIHTSKKNVLTLFRCHKLSEFLIHPVPESLIIKCKARQFYF